MVIGASRRDVSAVPVMTTGATPPPGMMAVISIERDLGAVDFRETRLSEEEKRKTCRVGAEILIYLCAGRHQHD